MATVQPLPENPDLDRLRGQSRLLQRSVRAGDAEAIALVARQHPDGAPDDPATFGLAGAQLVVARTYGFASWPKLERFVDAVIEHRWDDTSPATGESPADEFCRLACLTYRDDDRRRQAQARHLLDEHPDLTAKHIWAAAAASDAASVRNLLEAAPGLARRRGGPYRWTPLAYLCYSRLDLYVPAEPVLAIAGMLLDAGTDPGEGYVNNGKYPFTLLTGVLGEGEGGDAQPRHPHSLALARLLLDAGANPNDSQALYNRMFRPANDHLELLFEYGLGTGETYPWREWLAGTLDSPAELLRFQLRWAIEHGFAERVELLSRHGVDVSTPFEDGRTPVDLAVLSGNTTIADGLVAKGAAPARLDPADELVAAALRGDVETVERLRASSSAIVDDARRARPGLMVWAVASGRAHAVPLLAELGFDVNALGRSDAPVEEEWETALHHVAGDGDLDLAGRLLDLGADPNIRDCRFDSTPLGWARHFGRDTMAEFLEPLTTEEPSG